MTLPDERRQRGPPWQRPNRLQADAPASSRLDETRATEQLWLFWLAPIVGALIGAAIYRIIGSER